MIDPLVDRYNKLQLEAWVRLEINNNQYDFTHLIGLIREIELQLNKPNSPTKLEDIPNINKLVHVENDKLKDRRPIQVETPIVNDEEYREMQRLIETRTAPSEIDISAELEMMSPSEIDISAELKMRPQSPTIVEQNGGNRKSKRKRSRRKVKRTIKKRKRKQSRKRY